jgi:hypothetical protein
MSNVRSLMFPLAFASALASGGVFVGCVSKDDVDPEASSGSASGGTGNTTAGSASGGTTSTAGTSTAAAGTAAGGTATALPPACATVLKASGTSPVITDFESMTLATGTYMFDAGAMTGGTYIYTDPLSTPASTSMLSLAEGHVAASTKALVGKISNPTWGGGMGLWFSCQDANVYKGVTFWARGSSPAGPVKLNLTVNEALKVSEGGPCPDAGPCVRPYVTFEITDEWTEQTFAWADFTAGDAAGTPIPGGADTLYGLDFGLTNDNTARDLELAVDDFAFTTE